MPNHVTNELTAPETVIRFLRNPNGEVDFNTVIPMPAALRLPPGCSGISSHVIDWARFAVGHLTINELSSPVDANDMLAVMHRAVEVRAIKEGPMPKDFSDQDFDHMLHVMKAIRLTGYPSWYEWSTQHWGVKWNAYQTKLVNPTCVKFQTPWSAPVPVFKKLCEMFPTEKLTLRWADEDFGYNTGVLTFDKVMTETSPTNQSDLAKELALELIYDGKLPSYLTRDSDGHINRVDYDDDDE